ncbi:hypothetical protein EVAR_69874_1 [Eumeta japonica]|uniref:Uncharacterized protein n=1 Tax=Eumeta variegata TaxID=151549 RepID=A0A4C2ACC6_EUMVA|nr:hypothetical protein EVAR_69874_1 [Eumeta japonica]
MSPSTSQSAANRTLQNFSTRLPSPSNSVILGTALVDVYKDDLKCTVRALIDSASEATFISKKLQRHLGLNTRVSEAQIHGLSDSVTATSAQSCEIKIGSPVDPSFELASNALVITKLTGQLAYYPSTALKNSNFSKLQLADIYRHQCSEIDLLLGGDVYPKIIQDGLQWDEAQSLVAQKTVLDGLLLARISSIHEKLGKNAWSYVNFKNHLAYLTSRKSTNSELSNNELWWHGPPWLECPYNAWPSRIAVLESMEEERPLQNALSYYLMKLRYYAPKLKRIYQGPDNKVQYRFRTRFEEDVSVFTAKALITKDLPEKLPPKRLNRDVTDAYRNLRLADPEFFERNSINFIFGADIYPKIIRSGLQITSRRSPIAQDTVLGWVVIGSFQHDCI